jgi:hypothetical protein
MLDLLKLLSGWNAVAELDALAQEEGVGLL